MRGVGICLAVLGAAILVAGGAALAADVAGTPDVATGTTTVVTGGVTYTFTTPDTTTGGTTTLPAAPDAPKLIRTLPGDSGVGLTWSVPLAGSAPIDGYKIYRGTASGGETLLATLGNDNDGTDARYVDLAVVTGVTYYYEVSAFNAYGEGARSNELTATPGVPNLPGAPVVTSLPRQDATAALEWSTPDDGGGEITAYRIYRGTSRGGETLLTTLGVQNFYIDFDVAPGVTYYYEVSAVNETGEGPHSTTVSASVRLNVPEAPVLWGARTYADSIELDWELPWNGGAEITGYRIYRGTSSGGETLLVTTGPELPLVYVDYTPVPGTRYYYAVSAVNAGGESPLSNEVWGVAGPGDVPGKPNLTSAARIEGGVKLDWATPPDYGVPIGSYKVYRGAVSGGETLLATTDAVNSYLDTTAADDKTYYYKVSAENAFGEGPQSDERGVAPAGSLFEAYDATSVGSWPEAVAIGDVTGDGRNDVVMTTSSYFSPANDYHLFVFVQASDGTLLPPVSYPTRGGLGPAPQSVAIGDITGDGRGDVVVGLDRFGIQVFPQLASGALGTPVFNATTESTRIRLGRLNGDDRLDVAGLGWGSDKVSVLLNDGSGGLRTPVTYPAQHDGYDDLEVADVTGDGRDDLVVMSGQGFAPNVSVVPQLAGGGFGAAAEYRVATNVLSSGIGVGDITGDGRADVAVAYGGNRPSSFVAVLPQTALGTLGAPSTHPSYDIPEAADVADFDLDGRADVLTLHGGWNAVGLYRQAADGTLGPEELYGIPYASHYNPHGLAVGDVNGDGSPDAVLADYNHGLVVLRNAKNGFPPPPPARTPDPPRLDSAAAGNGTATLAWRAPASNGGSAITGYNVYRGTSPGGGTLLATLGDVLTYEDGGLTNGTTYSYRVTAVNAVGESAPSNEGSATPATVPGAPTLNAPTAGNATVNLTWVTPSNGGSAVTGYNVYRGTSSGAVTLRATLGNVTSYGETFLTNGTTYYYRVSAVNARGEGALSNEQSATPRVPDTTAPAKPANLRLVVAGTNQLALDWAASTDNVGVTGYEVLRGGNVIATVATTQYLDGALAAGTSYTYQVRALDAAANRSPLSSNLGAKTVSLANSSSGTLSGVAYDTAGAPLANAAVKVTLLNGSTKSTKTNSSGLWKVSMVAPGSYSVTATPTGFGAKTFTMTAVAGKTVLAVTTFG